jgi:hypothetical protein
VAIPSVQGKVWAAILILAVDGIISIHHHVKQQAPRGKSAASSQ